MKILQAEEPEPAFEPVVANPDESPCVDDEAGLLAGQRLPEDAPDDEPHAILSLLFAETDAREDDPATADQNETGAKADGGVAFIVLTDGANTLIVQVLTAEAEGRCVPDGEGGFRPELTGKSAFVSATIIQEGEEPTVIALPADNEAFRLPDTATDDPNDEFAIHVNETIEQDRDGDGTTDRLTQRALWLEAEQGDIIVGEAVADFTGNPCERVVEEEEGRITIVKDTEPNDPQDFRFTGNVEDGDQEFELDDDGVEGPLVQETDADEQQPSRASFDRPPSDDYVVTEEEVEGFELEDIDCDDPSGDTVEDEENRTARINLAAGEEVVCTFKNVRQARVTVVKDTQPDDPQDFRFRLRCDADDDNDDNNNDDNNNDDDNNDDDNNNDDNNNDDKDNEFDDCDERFQLDDDGNPAGEGNGTNADDEDLPNSRTFSVPAGRIQIRERKEEGFTTSVECEPTDDERVSQNGRRVRFRIEPGEHVTCTFTNVKDDDDDGRVKVVKDTVPDSNQEFGFRFRHDPDDEGDDTDVQFSLQDNGNEGDGKPSSRTFENLDAGEVRVREDEVDGFTTTSECKDDGSGQVLADDDGDPARVRFQLAEDQQVTCTFTNRADQDDDEGRVKVVKDTVPDSNQEFDFRFRHDPDDDEGERTEAEFKLQDNGDEGDGKPSSRTFGSLDAGEVRVREDEVDGFTTTSECKDDETGQVLADEDGDPARVRFQLAEDQQVTCTFTNAADQEEDENEGRVKVVKDTVPDSDQEFEFEFRHDPDDEGERTEAEFKLKDNEERTFDRLAPGEVRVEEDEEEGFTTNSECKDDETGQTVADEDNDPAKVRFQLAEDQQVTCTFTNTADAEEPEEPQDNQGTIEIRKDIVDADKDGSPVFHYVGDLGEFDLSENDESGVPDRREFTVAAGQYEVTEEDDPEDGFELFRIRCQGDEDGGTPEQQGPAFGGDNTARIDLDPGEDIRCRFLNTTDGNDPGNSGPGNADPEDDDDEDEDDDNSGSGSGGGGNSGPGRLASRAF